MKKRFFTVLFLPSNPSNVRKMVVSDFLVKALAFSVVILFSASSVVFIDYVKVKWREVDLTNIREQTKIQNVQLLAFADKIRNMEGELARLRSLDTKIRVLTRNEFEEKGQYLSLAGQGGPELTTISFNEEGHLEELMEKIERLNLEAREQEKVLHEMHKSIEDEKALMASTPSGWPTKGFLVSGFGERQNPFGGGNREFHDGLDISTPEGNPIFATANGVVLSTGQFNDLGKYVEIDHGYGYITRYGHMSRILAKEGQVVVRGDKIGEIGNTGRSTGPHVHYEIKVNGFKVNPIRYIN